MPECIVKSVQTRDEKKAFLELPWKLHRQDPLWIPPLRRNQKELVGYAEHPFYRDAEIQTFLAQRSGETVGRAAAILNHAHNRRHNEQIGFFGFFESVNDAEVADKLFQAVKDWFAKRDILHVRGPMNPSMNYECGLLVEGFDKSPTFMMTYNPDYYPALVEGAGFKKEQDMYAYEGHVDMLATLDKKLEFIVHSATERFEIELRRMRTDRFQEEVELFLDIYNRSMGGTWGFVPLSGEEIRHMAKQMKHLIIPELAIVGEVKGEPIGVVFTLPDFNPRIKDIDGKLFPFGFWKLISGKRKIERIRLIATNVVPEYQRWGVGIVLLNGLVPHVMESAIQEAEFSWVLESNHLSRGSLERGGAHRTRTYRLYDWTADN